MIVHDGSVLAIAGSSESISSAESTLRTPPARMVGPTTAVWIETQTRPFAMVTHKSRMNSGGWNSELMIR